MFLLAALLCNYGRDKCLIGGRAAKQVRNLTITGVWASKILPRRNGERWRALLMLSKEAKSMMRNLSVLVTVSAALLVCVGFLPSCRRDQRKRGTNLT